MRAAKTDANQTEIVSALRSAGCKVQSLASVGDGVPDLLVGLPNRRLVLVEVKDGDKPPSDRKLTPKQVTWHAQWEGWPVYVVESIDHALNVVYANRA
jgi:Holliday junction resolvase